MPAFLQPCPEMPHGREKKNQSDLVLGEVCSFFSDFDHKNGIAFPVELVEGRRGLG